MKALALGFILALGFSQTLFAQDISNEAFQITILNEDKVKDAMTHRLQYFQGGELTSAACSTKVCCRFNWAGDKGEPIIMVKTITATFRLDSTIKDPVNKNVVAVQVGIGFKEIPIALTCTKPSDSPVSGPDIADSLKGIAKISAVKPEVPQRPRTVQEAALRTR